jgi:hypothetical protein
MPHEPAYPIADFIVDIGDIEHSVDAMTIRR